MKLAAASPRSPVAAMSASSGVAEASTEGSSLPVLGTMPEFANVTSWLNSPPLTSASLRGKVVLVDFWTYSCINCIRTLPFVTRWYEKYRDQGLVVVGVHTPEFSFEKDGANVKKAIARYGIRYPVALDNFYGTWNAYNNNVWPAHYLFDARGRLREVHFGEGEYEETERSIRSLLSEAKLLHAASAIDRPRADVDFSLIESPETYIGYGRAQNFSSPEAVRRDKTHNYSSPPALRLNGWALRGPWKVTEEAAVLTAPGGGIRFHFKARQLNLVMRRDGGKYVKATVLLDGKPVSPGLRGSDVGPDGKLAVGDSRLYNLVNLSVGDRRDHLFEIEFEDAGVELYAFTFG